LIAIKTTGLTKKYGSLVAVDNVNLEIYEGELFSLLGINGAGKTTMIKMLSCLAQPTEGDAMVLGNSIKSQDTKVKEVIAISPQETAVAANLTVRENLEFMCGIHGFDRNMTEEKINKLTEEFGLGEILSKKSSTLSGGWQRRLSIAMALISEPKILFLDEPTLGLDVIARSELWDKIKALKGKTTIILTTHYMEEAETLSDRIGIMKNGRMLALGRTDELMAMTNARRFEDAFISIVKEERK
jgi:ABC-2 type transport system ATP-binding protein